MPRKPKTKPARRFICTFEVEIEVEQALLDAVLTDEWRQTSYRDVTKPEDVAMILAYNMMQGATLAQLDGFADQPEGRAKVVEIHWGEAEEQSK